jgi:hypothetical protein
MRGDSFSGVKAACKFDMPHRGEQKQRLLDPTYIEQGLQIPTGYSVMQLSQKRERALCRS